MRDQYWTYDQERGWIARQRPSRPCPRCGGPAVRVSRRFVDRAYSLLRPVQRYQCRSAECGWIGNLMRGSSEWEAKGNVWVVGLVAALSAFIALGLALLVVFI